MKIALILENSQVVVLWGMNPLNTLKIAWSSTDEQGLEYFHQLKKSGKPVIAIDPIRSETIEFFEEHKENKIVKKLKPLQDVGLGYIRLGQSSSTLSGGENQRVKLAFYLSQEKADPTLFIFDEPTTGLHFHDIKKLLEAFDALIERGHSIIIIEHNMDVIKCADYVIDLGPEGGIRGGEIIATGTPEEIANHPESYTGQFLKEKLTVS